METRQNKACPDLQSQGLLQPSPALFALTDATVEIGDGSSFRMGSLGRSHEEDAPKCIFSAAPSSSHHFVVGTMTRPRFLQYKPACEFSSAASCATPFRAAIAFLQSSCKTHFNKDRVDLSVQQHFVRSAIFDSSAAHQRRRGTDVLLLGELALLVVVGRGTSFAASDLSIVLLSSA